MSFWRRPQTTRTRRILFQLHTWIGVVAGAYALFIGLTGAVLMFRPELQQRAYPEFFRSVPADARLADPATVFASLASTFPGYRFSGIDYPNDRRGTFLAYLSRGPELKTVFADPVSGQVIGELPRSGWIQQLQDLHFNFRAGSLGYVVNGVGATCLLVMCLTGLVIWWPGLDRVAQAFLVNTSRGWKRIIWELHGAVGVWALLLLLSWSLSGIYFSFPTPFRATVAMVAPLTESRPPASTAAISTTPPSPASLIAQARQRFPGSQLARFVLPAGASGSYAVVLARHVHGDWDSSDEVTVYFDQHSGAWLRTDDHSGRTVGDALLTWLGLLHVGTFGGLLVKLLWAVAALAFPTLFLTGLVMWWNRFVRPALWH